MVHQPDARKQPPDIAIVAGMPRAGTTTLYNVLQDHPQAFLPFRKESSYFIFNYDRGPEWYQGLYRKMCPGQVGFDITPAYIFDEAAIGRIVEFNPRTRVILIVRDPAEWVVSFYRQMASADYQIPTFEQFMHAYDFRVGAGVMPLSFSDGLIPRMIQRYRQAFGDKLLVIDYRLLKPDLLRVLRSIEAFVGLPPYFRPGNFRDVVINASTKRNIKFISWLLSREHLITALHWLMPEGLVRFMRRQSDLLRVRQARPAAPPPFPPEHLQLAREVFADQSKAVAELLADYPVQLGSGRPFVVPPLEDAAKVPSRAGAVCAQGT